MRTRIAGSCGMLRKFVERMCAVIMGQLENPRTVMADKKD